MPAGKNEMETREAIPEHMKPQEGGLKKAFAAALPLLPAIGIVYSAVTGDYALCAIYTAILALLLAAWFFASAYFFRLTIMRGRADKLPAFSAAKMPSFPIHKKASEWWDSSALETLEMTSRDGLLLRGYYLKNPAQSGRLAVLAHGYKSKAAGMAVYAKIYYDLGFDVFAPDCRAHGESGGIYNGMGWLDRHDFLDWLVLLSKRGFGSGGVILHGESMGGAAVCMLSGERLPPNVRGIISDCGYESVKNEFIVQLRSMFNLPPFPVVSIGSLICKLRAGYFFGEANAAAQVGKSAVPILFIHGEADRFVPFPMVHKLYNAANPALRELWTLPGAGHAGSVELEPEKYAQVAAGFVKKIFE